MAHRVVAIFWVLSQPTWLLENCTDRQDRQISDHKLIITIRMYRYMDSNYLLAGFFPSPLLNQNLCTKGNSSFQVNIRTTFMMGQSMTLCFWI